MGNIMDKWAATVISMKVSRLLGLDIVSSSNTFTLDCLVSRLVSPCFGWLPHRSSSYSKVCSNGHDL